jgi:uncharacterized YccA/Bax inhibitor family protein
VIRSGNPTLSANVFTLGARGFAGEETMTLEGTVNKTFILFFCLLFGAMPIWWLFFQGSQGVAMLAAMGGMIFGLILALVTVFKKTWAPVTAPLYALAEGVFLGGISALFEARYPAIVMQAVALTFGVLFALLTAYRTGIIKPTENFKLGVAAATGGIMLVYLVTMVLGFFGVSVGFIHGSGLFGIGFSLFVVTIAALNLVMDFDFIEQGAERGAPKHMEWFGAFGLIVTLVWLYIEILHLLAKLRDR